MESGGLHADNFANLDVTGTSFVRNSAIAGGLRENISQLSVQFPDRLCGAVTDLTTRCFTTPCRSSRFSAGYGGAALMNGFGNLTFSDCTFTENTATMGTAFGALCLLKL